jgi:hypothetical protein
MRITETPAQKNARERPVEINGNLEVLEESLLQAGTQRVP